jgi:hypothetical protein
VVAQSLFQASEFLFNFVFNIVIAKVFSLLLAFRKKSMAEVQLFLQKSSNVIFWTMVFWIVIVQTPYIYFYCCFIVDREDVLVQQEELVQFTKALAWFDVLAWFLDTMLLLVFLIMLVRAKQVLRLQKTIARNNYRKLTILKWTFIFSYVLECFNSSINGYNSLKLL